MKMEWKVITGAGVFLALIYVLYWFTSYEDAGSTMLLFGGCAYLMLGGFLLMQWRRRRGVPRPEDSHSAEQHDGEGEIGFFPAASIWPAGIGLGAILIVLGMIWGTWYIILGLPLVLGSIIGFSVEAEAGIDAVEEIEATAHRDAGRDEAPRDADRTPS